MTETPTTNPYPELSLWRFGLVATVIMAYLPWPLLVHGVLRGFGDTRLLIAALIKDYIQTVIATLTLGLLLVIAVVVGGCTKFCVNGLMAGSRLIHRSGYDRSTEARSTQGVD